MIGHKISTLIISCQPLKMSKHLPRVSNEVLDKR